MYIVLCDIYMYSRTINIDLKLCNIDICISMSKIIG